MAHVELAAVSWDSAARRPPALSWSPPTACRSRAAQPRWTRARVTTCWAPHEGPAAVRALHGQRALDPQPPAPPGHREGFHAWRAAAINQEAPAPPGEPPPPPWRRCASNVGASSGRQGGLTHCAAPKRFWGREPSRPSTMANTTAHPMWAQSGSGSEPPPPPAGGRSGNGHERGLEHGVSTRAHVRRSTTASVRLSPPVNVLDRRLLPHMAKTSCQHGKQRFHMPQQPHIRNTRWQVLERLHIGASPPIAIRFEDVLTSRTTTDKDLDRGAM